MANKKKKIITKSILILSFVSLFTDIASEMLYPVTPIFLTSYLGASMAVLGVLEGFAEAIAGFSKGYFGLISDRMQKRKIFVIAGYSLSAISKPIPGIWQNIVSVFFARFGDRIGKGLRTAPRDALLSSYSDPENKGAVFGFHRGMDTLGAAIGPAVALVFLYFYPQHYREVFLLAFFPSFIAILLTFFIKEEKISFDSSVRIKQKYSDFWKSSPKEFKQLIYISTFFALFNSSDVFLIIRAKEVFEFSGITKNEADIFAIIGYIYYNIIYALSSYPLGILSDKIGKKKVFSLGILLFSIVYLGFAIGKSLIFIWLLFALYGIYAASTEGILKAWISKIIKSENLATAIGLQTSITSLCFIFASSLAGFIWTYAGSSIALSITSVAGFITLFLINKFNFVKN